MGKRGEEGEYLRGESVKTHKDLEVWKKGIDLVEDIYRVTQTFPTEEMYGLTSQMRRSSVSIPSNVAEGAARQSTKEFLQFLYIALGFLSEIETQLVITQRLGYTLDEKIGNDIEILRRQMLNFIKYKKSVNE
jgi:four helix bundle protein